MEQPRSVVEGLLGGPRVVGPLTLYPCSLAHYLLLQKRGHRAIAVENPELSAFEWLELAFILARPSRDACRAIQAGEDSWNEEVITFGEGVPLETWPAIRAEVQSILREAFAAAPPPSGDAKKKSQATDSTP